MASVPLRLCRLDFTEDRRKEPGRLEPCLCVRRSGRAVVGSRARKRDAGATRALVAGGKPPLGAAWRDTAPLGRS